MEVVKKLEGYVIYKKRSGRYAVKNQRGQWINGEEKTKILLDNELIKLSVAKKPQEPEQEEQTVASDSEQEASAEA